MPKTNDTHQRARDRRIKRQKSAMLKCRESGNSITACYLSVGISKATFYRWKSDDLEFDEAFELAGGSAQIALLGKLKRMAEDKGDWRGIAWVLERGWPADWGLKREIEVSTTNTNKGAHMVLEMLRQADERGSKESEVE